MGSVLCVLRIDCLRLIGLIQRMDVCATAYQVRPITRPMTRFSIYRLFNASDLALGTGAKLNN